MKIALPVLHCLRCGWFWIPRGALDRQATTLIDVFAYVEVHICPRCKTRLFDIPKKKKG